MQIRRKANRVTSQNTIVPARPAIRLLAPAIDDAPEEIDAVHFDLLGSVRAAARADGSVAERAVLEERAQSQAPGSPQPVDALKSQAQVAVRGLRIQDAAAVVSRNPDGEKVLKL